MTEAEWLACEDPQAMLTSLGLGEAWLSRGLVRQWLSPRPRVSERKLWFFAGAAAAAEAEADWNSDDQAQVRRWRRLAALLELHADGQARPAELKAARAAVEWETDSPTWWERWLGAPDLSHIDASPHPTTSTSPRTAASLMGYFPRSADVLRELLGNPYRPSQVSPAWLVWNDRLVHRLAQGIYEDRAFDRLPILADALEEAGCSDPDLLGHLRSPGPHVRGCWALDLVLGKQ